MAARFHPSRFAVLEDHMKRALTSLFLLTLLSCVVWAQAPQTPAAAPTAQPAQAGRGGGGGGRPAVTPRVVSFDASPVSIKPGESFLLSWAAEAGSPSIDNGIGPVPLRGTIK